MITYRNEIWNVLINFLDVLRNHKALAIWEDGRYIKRINGIYNKALSKCHLRGSDINLLTDTFRYLNEKDFTAVMTEICEIGSTYKIDCLTTKDGEDIFKKAETEYDKNETVKELKAEILQAEIDSENADKEHEAFLNGQKQTKANRDKKRNDLAKYKKTLKKMTLEAVEVEETEETLEEGIKCQI